MRVSLAFTGMAPVEPTLPAVQAADHHGLDGVWVAEHVGFHDAIVPATVYLRATERLEIGLVGFSAAPRHPGLLAMELASLCELGPSRVRVAVGTGEPSLVAKLGARVERPARSTASLVQSLREALAGREMNVAHPGFAFRGFRIAPQGPPPAIDVMAIRPLMVRTAARVGDGISLSVGASKRYLRETVRAIDTELAAAGRQRESFRVCALVFGLIAEDLAKAREQIAPIIALAEPGMAEHLARGVLAPGSLVSAAQEGGPFAVGRLLTPDVIDAIALVATPDGVGDALAAYAETGIDELSVALFASPDEQPGLVKLLADAQA